MSIKQEEYSFYYKVKNESARKRLGFKASFFWCTAKKQSLALSRGELAMDAAGFDEADFARPVRVHFPVENDIPPEGVFDTKFCENREPGGEDGKTLTLIPGAASAVKSDETERAVGAGTPAGENGIQESHNPPANPQLTVVATLPFRHRVLAQYIGEGEYLYHVDASQKKEILRLEMDTDNSYVQNLLLAAENVEAFKKAIEHDIHKIVNAVKKVFPVDGKTPELATVIQFLKTWFETEHIDRGLLVKEWAKGNRVSAIQRTESGTNAGDGNKTDRNPDYEHTLDTLDVEIAMATLPMDFNIYELPGSVYRRAKKIVKKKESPFKEWSAALRATPGTRLKDGGTQFEVMTRKQIELVRAQSKAGNNGPWVTHWEEMAKKTAIRRLFKYLPVSIEIQRAVSMDEKETLTIDPADASVITGEYSVVENAGVEENVTA
ncbi:hypothetical protein IZR33_000615 [Salmonella enterica]|nr:hypothetical protein [Salmonella enterica]EGG2763419.1 hypothetical protein [Salmonella enterica]EGP4409128.1 hypothetical protein [Salmonella enterica]